MSTPPSLITGVYQPTSAFLAIPLHTAVCTGTGDLIALTGPADNPLADFYAVLFVAAPGLLTAARNGVAACNRLAQIYIESGDFESADYWTQQAVACEGAVKAAPTL